MSREWGWLLVAAGFLLIMISFMQAAWQGNANYGGVILIGPIPIVFGSNPGTAAAAMLLAVALMILSFLLFLGLLLLHWPQRKEKNRYFPNSGEEEEHAKMRGGGVVMLGPIPIVVGSDPKTALLMMALALAIMILWALTAKGAWSFADRIMPGVRSGTTSLLASHLSFSSASEGQTMT
ncbi:MAG: DUF131 domain-containing protein [Methanothrix sp.]|nr:DUF131 domain-containing protein [Methanothrix sp.]